MNKDLGLVRGTYTYINTSGAAITFNFTGVSLSIIARTASNYGNLTVTLDGVSKTVSLYSPSALYQKTVWSSGFLRPGNHTVGTTSLTAAWLARRMEGMW